MRDARSSSPVNTTARPSLWKSAGVAARSLEDGAVGRERSGQRHQPADRGNGVVERADDLAVDPGERFGQTLGERAAGDVDRVEMEKRLQLAEQCPHSAGSMEIFHVALAYRL